MWGWIAGGIVAVVVIVWYVVGSSNPATGSNGGIPSGNKDCGMCTGLDHWWAGLNWFQRLRMRGIYNARRSDCKQRGCSTA